MGVLLGAPPCSVLRELDQLIGGALDVDWGAVEGDVLADGAELLLAVTDRLDALRMKVVNALDVSGVWAEQGAGMEFTRCVRHGLLSVHAARDAG